jgi:hypothetical protein
MDHDAENYRGYGNCTYSDPYNLEICDDQGKCWHDGASDISGTAEDPAVYISVAVACFASGLCILVGSEAGWQALRVCSSIPVCLDLVIKVGVFYPTNNGFANSYIYQDLEEEQIIM